MSIDCSLPAFFTGDKMFLSVLVYCWPDRDCKHCSLDNVYTYVVVEKSMLMMAFSLSV